MKILAIDTSCDETSVAITNERRVIANVIFSQIAYHKPFGGVYPLIAKREHLTKIKPAINIALKRARLSEQDLDAVAVTFGPGLAPALEVGINSAKTLAIKNKIPLIPVDHIEGHIYSSFVNNQKNKPSREFVFPIISLIVSGGHTEIIILKNQLEYQILGSTLDDACGEALDKAAKILNLGYPGGPIIEALARKTEIEKFSLPLPMLKSNDLNYSYSGLKTAFKRLVENLSEKEKLESINELCSTFQKASFRHLLNKFELAIKQNDIKTIVAGGGVLDNQNLRKLIRGLAKKYSLPIYFPSFKYLSGDNAAMIGVVAFFKYQKGIILKSEKEISKLDRIPRANLNYWRLKNI